MGTVIGIIILVVIWGLYKYSTEQKVQNKSPLDIDDSKMAHDIAHGVSRSEVNRRYGNGYYDKNR